MRNANEVYSQLVAEQLSRARRSTVSLVGYVVIATGAYAYADIFHYDSDGIYFALAFVVWGLGYLLLVRLLQASAAKGEITRGGIGGYFVLGLLISMRLS
ncbi:MAG: hypothetical protein ABJP70_11565 [Erythrobacter sp.]